MTTLVKYQLNELKQKQKIEDKININKHNYLYSIETTIHKLLLNSITLFSSHLIHILWFFRLTRVLFSINCRDPLSIHDKQLTRLCSGVQSKQVYTIALRYHMLYADFILFILMYVENENINVLIFIISLSLCYCLNKNMQIHNNTTELWPLITI